MNYIFLSNIGEDIANFFWGLLLRLAGLIYTLINYIYQVFLTITSNEGILDDSVINGFVDRLYIIIGVVTLFIIAYSLLKSMINPDEALKGKKSPVNIIKDVIISIVLITLLPTIFDFAFEVQNSILLNNTIGKLIAGSNSSISNAGTITEGGFELASTLWQAFFYPDEKYCTIAQENPTSNASNTGCEPLQIGETTWAGLWNEAKAEQNFFRLTGISKAIVSGDITYFFIIDIVVGIYALFVMGIYCVDMAVRLVKLSVYQIIAPLPILARIVPNESVSKMFSNWLKATISIFLEVFIRVALLFFVIIIINSAVSSIDDLMVLNFSGPGALMISGVAQVLIIIGIIKFMKDAPAIIKEITGLDGGKYGKSLIQGAGMLLGGMGTVGTTAIRNAASKYNDVRLKGGNKWKAAGLGALSGLTSAAMQKGFVKGAMGGRKVEKFGDIPKTTSKSISAYAAQQRTMKQKAGESKWITGAVKGWLGYEGAMIGLKKDKAINWIQGGATEDTRAQQAINEMTKLLDDIEQVFKRDPGYNKSKEEYMQSAGFKTKLEGFVKTKNTLSDGSIMTINGNQVTGAKIVEILNDKDASEADKAAAMELANKLTLDDAISKATLLDGKEMTINGSQVDGAKIMEILNDTTGAFTAADKAEAKTLASKLAIQERQNGYKYAAQDAADKKAILDGIELTVKRDKSKSNQIASIVNEFQGTFARYDDLGFADLKKLEEANIITATEREIVRNMPQLNTPGAQADFAKRLQNGDQEALDYLKIINRIKDNMKNEAANITRRQNDRKAVEEQSKKDK